MRLKRSAIKLRKKINTLPKEITISVGVLFFIILGYGVIFGFEKPVQFSYSQPTCVRQLTLLPAIHKISGQASFKVQTAGNLKIAGYPLAASKLCFIPTDPPKQGIAKVSTSPFGGLIARRTFAIKVAPPVTANISTLNKPLPVSKPLVVPLDAPDKVFSYVLKVDDKEANCTAKDSKLLCDIQALKLGQGKTYHVKLTRYFKDEKVTTIATKEVQTLSATTVTDSSIKGGETVYAKPKTIDLVIDKKITNAQPILYRIEGDKRVAVETTHTLTPTGLQVAFKEDLPRSLDYELTVDKVEAIDGSTLESPYKLAFRTSGGPRVTGTNVGRTGVALGTTVVISFDQPLSDKQDVSGLIGVGGGAVFAGKRGNQILVSLANVPKCGDFSIKVANDLMSNYDIGGNSAWSFASRTICHTVSTIGYSSKGRPINAYFFGNGSRTVMFTGAIHGNEASTKSLMDRWIQDLEANARNIPGDKQVVVVPQINPDGVASGSRVNAHNVDLNRNFATSDWRTDITDVNNRPFPGGGGPSPMSEPETAAIASLAGRLHPMLILSYHSIGGLLAANQAGSSNAFAALYSQLSGYANTTGQSGTFEYQVSGTADDWYAEQLGVGSILIELGSHTYNQFERNQRAMWAMVNG